MIRYDTGTTTTCAGIAKPRSMSRNAFATVLEVLRTIAKDSGGTTSSTRATVPAVMIAEFARLRRNPPSIAVTKFSRVRVLGQARGPFSA